MYSMSTINEQYLNRLYEDLAQEQQRLMGSLKSTLAEEGAQKEKDVTKQLSLINTLMISTLRFRNLRKTISMKDF